MKKHVLPLICFVIAGCSNSELASFVPDNRPDYRQSRLLNSLEMPPNMVQNSVDDGLQVAELTGTENAQLSTYQTERSGQQSQQLANSLKYIHHLGDVAWLESRLPPDHLFNEVVSFWKSQGLNLTRVDNKVGIIETDWLTPQNNLPKSGLSKWVSGVLGGVFESGVRDKYRVRIDYDGALSRVYLTHYGASEEVLNKQGKITKSKRNDNGTTDYAWVATQRDPNLETEMLRRLNLYLLKQNKAGTEIAQSTPAVKALPELIDLNANQLAIVIHESYAHAWILLGNAIDRSGYELEAQNKNRGLYQFALYEQSKSFGFFGKTQKNLKATYTLGLSDQGLQQLAVLTAIDGTNPDKQAARAVLERIMKNL